ncbi:MAG: hypothetical protein Q9216_005228 [Gyalolechia sp. 2 TL-2023]
MNLGHHEFCDGTIHANRQYLCLGKLGGGMEGDRSTSTSIMQGNTSKANKVALITARMRETKVKNEEAVSAQVGVKVQGKGKGAEEVGNLGITQFKPVIPSAVPAHTNQG